MIFLSLSEVKKILFEQKPNIAMVGVSRDSKKASHIVFKYFLEKGFTVYPINPLADKILKINCFNSVEEIPFKIDIVNIFRKSEEVMPFVEQAIKKKTKLVWLQLGIENEKAKKLTKENNVLFVQNNCLKVFYEKNFTSV